MANAADRNQVKELADVGTRQREQELADFAKVLQTPEGRRFIWRLLERTGVFRTSFTGNSTTFFNEGQRNVGLLIMGDLNEACPERYVQMMNESRRGKDARNDS